MADPTEPALPRFDRRLFGGKEPATRMGDGPVGGKAAGLIRIRDTLASAFPGACPDFEVSIPTMSVATADHFDRFVEENRLEEVAFSGEPDDAIKARFAGLRYGDLKKQVAEMVIAHLEPFQQRYREITGEPGYLASVLRQGAERVAPIATQTVRLVKDRMGLY